MADAERAEQAERHARAALTRLAVEQNPPPGILADLAGAPSLRELEVLAMDGSPSADVLGEVAEEERRAARGARP